VSVSPLAGDVDDDEVAVCLEKFFDLLGINLNDGTVGINDCVPCRGGRGILRGAAPTTRRNSKTAAIDLFILMSLSLMTSVWGVSAVSSTAAEVHSPSYPLSAE
jgi:hypothetical protein